MATTSAGLLLYRRTTERGVEVLLGHMGGPFWARRDEGAWTVLKGELEPGEDAHAAAVREVTEELGFELLPAVGPEGGTEADMQGGTGSGIDRDIDLGSVRQKSGKRVLAWGREADVDPADVRGNTVEIEWPPRSGRRIEVPEIDRVGWFLPDDARRVVVSAQAAFIDRLVAALALESQA